MVSKTAAGNSLVTISRPALGPEEEAQLLGVLRSAWVGQGPKVAEFERELASLLGVEHVVAVSSGTAALHLALLAVGVGRDDAVIVPDFTFPASANAVRHCGAEPILLDIDLDTLNLGMDALNDFFARETISYPNGLRDRRSGRTIKAIMPVHLFGLPLPMAPIMAFAEQHRLAVVEDAACALGAREGSAYCGTRGDVGCFSFHPRKVITTGEGGLMVTQSGKIADTLRELRNHGMRRTDGKIVFSTTGFNFRMSDINAAVGVAQLGKLQMICNRHDELARWYNDELSGVPGLRLPKHVEGRIYQAYVVLIEAADRDAVIAHLKECGIETLPGTYAVSAQPAYGGAKTCGNALRAYDSGLALPLHTGLDRETLSRVCAELRAAMYARKDPD